MKIYRVKFETDLLVEAESPAAASRIGRGFLIEEVGNGMSKVGVIVELRTQGDLRHGEHFSLPWRDRVRRNEPEVVVRDLLPRDEKHL